MSDNPHLLYQDASTNSTPDNDLGGDQFTDSSILDPDYEDGHRILMLRFLQSALGDGFDETDLNALSKAIDQFAGSIIKFRSPHTIQSPRDSVNYTRYVDENGNRIGYIGNNSSRSVDNYWGSDEGRCIVMDTSGSGYAWHAGNTTTDSNGALKPSSPIFRVANEATTVTNDQFAAAGAGGANGEADGVTAEHKSTGVYVVSGSLGFATDGVWPIPWVIPQDGNGNNLVFVETDQADDGTLTIKTYSRKFDVSTASVVADQPMDIPDGRWVDLRLKMPEPDESEAE